VLRVWVSDESEACFLHTLDVGEEDFAGLKAQQGILVDFGGFPGKLIGLLDRCVSAAQQQQPPRCGLYAALSAGNRKQNTDKVIGLLDCWVSAAAQEQPQVNCVHKRRHGRLMQSLQPTEEAMPARSQHPGAQTCAALASHIGTSRVMVSLTTGSRQYWPAGVRLGSRRCSSWRPTTSSSCRTSLSPSGPGVLSCRSVTLCLTPFAEAACKILKLPARAAPCGAANASGL